MVHLLARTLRRGAASAAALALGAHACDNGSGASPAQAQSDSNALASSIGSLLPKLITPATLTEIINALKNSNVIAALKQAWAQGTCKAEISGLTQAGIALLKQVAPSLLLGRSPSPDLTAVTNAFEAVGACFAKAAPDILSSLESALSSSSAASKVVDRDLFVVTPEHLSALDTRLWPVDGEAEGGAPAATEGGAEAAGSGGSEAAGGSAATAAPGAAPMSGTGTAEGSGQPEAEAVGSPAAAGGEPAAN